MTVRSLRLYINPSWSVDGYEDYVPLPEGWDDWTENDQNTYVEEILNSQVEDRGYDVIEEHE